MKRPAFLAKGLLAVVILLVVTGCKPSKDHPSVRVDGAEFMGRYEDEGVHAFLGIPFAQPPVGDLRWERPEAITEYSGSIDATAFAPACMQSGSGLDWYHRMMGRVGVDPSLMIGPTYSEDCLYLNVWTDNDTAEPKPVLVFIHGGSNTGGWSYEPNYHGGPLAQRGVVVVSVAYRLGVFGWLSHPDMPIQNPGLHDLAVALDWVHDHIAAFGGDPNRIVVSGESAGADNALHLALLPSMAGRLSGVIHQSAGWSASTTLARTQGFALGRTLVKEHVGADGEFEGLKTISAAALMQSQLTLFQDHYFGPIPDPETLPVPLETLVSEGTLPPLRLLLGSNGNESLMYIPEGAVLEDYLKGGFPPESWADVRQLLASFGSELDQIDTLRSAIQYTCPSLMLAQATEQSGGEAYVYRFDRVRTGFESIGAYHGAELPYVFDTHDPWLPTDAIDRRITNELTMHWVSFLTNGNPSSSTGREWPQWDENQKAMVVSNELSVAAHPDVALCDALRALSLSGVRY